MKKIKIIGGLVATILAFSAFIDQKESDKPYPIPPSPQRTGDAQKGYQYLVSGDYVNGGLPYFPFLMGIGKVPILLEREGLNKKLPHDFNAVKAPNGEVLVAPNCLQCHASIFDGQLVIGLGNANIDFTKGQQQLNSSRLQMLRQILQKTAPKQYEASEPFLTVTETVAPYLFAPVRGVNVADRLTAVLTAHRDPVSFRWLSKAQIEIPEEMIPTDTPPWWLLKKKNAMFYNGFGRGDFGKFLMGSHLLTVTDTAESNRIDKQMPHLLSYIYSLEAPKYPKGINASLVKKGKTLFEARCSGCHGTYGEKETYPNLLIPSSIIQTDSLLFKSNYSHPQFISWFNRSWFTKGDHPAQLVPFHGYIAPPLDGVWMSAPYFHNGSVPTLEGVLNSKVRPRYWSRNFDKGEYDHVKGGWKYAEEKSAGNTQTYNTELPGFGNYGHYFGDRLKEEERKAVIEYLKTL